MSYLYINATKSSIFAVGRNTYVLLVAAVEAGISVDFLSIRYLRLPLTTKSMNHLDYDPLGDKIYTFLLSWTNKCLFFVGRLQLIKSVITSISNFWCSVF